MATSQDKALKFKDALRGKGSQIFLGAMALLLAGRIYFFMQESGFQNTNLVGPAVKTSIPSAVKPDTEAKVSQMINPLPEFTTTTFYALAQVNMFDAKAAQNANALVNRASQFVAQAQAALDQKNLAEAELMVKEALAVVPSLPAGLALRVKIKAARDAAAAPKTTPTPTPTPVRTPVG